VEHVTTTTTTPAADPMEALHQAIDGMVGTDSFSLSDPESLMALQCELARFTYVVAKAVAGYDQGGEWATDGAKTPGAWLATRCHLPKAEAKRQLRRGKVLPMVPLVAEAFAEGSIGAAQVDALAKVRTPATQDALARDEALLVDYAKQMKFEPFCRVLAYWAQHADPNGAEASDMERRARRDVSLVESIGGMYFGSMTLDPISGAIVADELTRLEQLLFDADWAEAKERLGRDPKGWELARTPAQRGADAMVEMAARSKSTPADARRPEPLFSVLVGYETLHGRICEVEGGAVVSPGTLFDWMDRARFERIVFAPGQRAEVSVKARFFTGATRRAIEVRDRACTHEYCDLPAKKCEIDHIVPYSDGGETAQYNGQVHCGFHNRLKNGRPPPGG
jgi:Domain of unknown function (DUF222)